MQSVPLPIPQPGDVPVPPPLEAMLDLAEMARHPALWNRGSFRDILWLAAILGQGFFAWSQSSVLLASLCFFTTISSVVDAVERRNQVQLRLILTILRDLQNRCQRPSDAVHGDTSPPPP